MKNKIAVIFLGCAFLVACNKNALQIPQPKKEKYYRIKQVDVDGKVTYSKVIKVVQ